MQTALETQTIIPILGDPVAQVATPDLWNRHFEAVGQNARCVPFHLTPDGLSAFTGFVRHAPNIPGFLTTVPHKTALPALCDSASPISDFLGLANTVRRDPDGSLHCTMFDGVGMVSAIEESGIRVSDNAILIIGAGAAGAAIAFEALQRGAARVVLQDPNEATLARVIDGLNDRYSGSRATSDLLDRQNYGAVINASPVGTLGMEGEPWPLSGFSRETIIADAVTDPNPTEWLRGAKAAGYRCVNGQQMAAHQAAPMRKFMGLEQ